MPAYATDIAVSPAMSGTHSFVKVLRRDKGQMGCWMRKISRSRRAEISRGAQRIRQHGLVLGWDVDRIADAISAEFPEMTLLEVRRLACGWTRAQVIDSIATLYQADGLATPGLNSSMLCRWEHGDLLPSREYVDALCRVYRLTPDKLGLPSRSFEAGTGTRRGRRSRYPAKGTTIVNGTVAAATVRESIYLNLELEGPTGGPATREQLQQTIDYYALNYSALAPSVLATEVHHCRLLVTGMLDHVQSGPARNDLRRVAGWQSALLGNLAFHQGDYSAAHIHLSTATRLGVAVGDARLICWSLGARSMVARHQHRYTEALDLACRALEHTTSPLTRAQILTWAELPALAHLGTQHRSDATRVLITARQEMDADPEGEQPGRFGFDVAEFELHAAEAMLVLKDPTQAADHARASLECTTVGRPGWAAASLLLALTEAQHNRPDQAVDLAITVLDTIPPESLRATTRQRVTILDNILSTLDRPGSVVDDLHERLRALPPLNAVGRVRWGGV